MLDAAPAIPLITKILKSTYKRLAKKGEEEGTDVVMVDPSNCDVTNVFEQCWTNQDLLETVRRLTGDAKEHHQQMTGEYEKRVVLYSGWGKKFLKQADFGPEVVSMAMQLAAYRLLGKQVGTYEAALARRFYHGRTDTARPVSPQSSAFVEAMGKEPYEGDEENKLYWLQEASFVHQEVQRLANSGRGVDRHLLGLSMMVQDDDDVVPALFSDPLFLRSKPLRLSTSTVIFTPGFGPVVDDGMGVGFQVAADTCMFTVTSRRENNFVEPFCDLLEEALDEIGDLIRPSY
jgi:hypothetical protein